VVYGLLGLNSGRRVIATACLLLSLSALRCVLVLDLDFLDFNERNGNFV
jgi:hypothetical protein